MKILLLSGVSATSSRIGTSLWSVGFLVLLLLLVAILGGGWYGYTLGLSHGGMQQSDVTANAVQQQLQEQKTHIQQHRSDTRDHLDALALRLGQMQSEILRLNALGQRLAELSELDSEEFDFSTPPARGGLESPHESRLDEPFSLNDLLIEMQQLAHAIEDREKKLGFLEELLMNRQLQREIFPAGSPVPSGWISSLYGFRKDPFSGRRSFHAGIDLAGRAGSNVVAVASGIVTNSSYRGGYGNTVEIRHGNGYSTLYAHLQERLVETGELVTKGEVIGLLGSTGRSTGPHVHFEVALNGESVDPKEFMREIQ